MKKTRGIELLLQQYTQSDIAGMANVSRQAVNRWKSSGIPLAKVRLISTATGIPAKVLRPDAF